MYTVFLGSSQYLCIVIVTLCRSQEVPVHTSNILWETASEILERVSFSSFAGQLNRNIDGCVHTQFCFDKSVTDIGICTPGGCYFLQASFFRQFFQSVSKVDYFILRHGFIMVTDQPLYLNFFILGLIPSDFPGNASCFLVTLRPILKKGANLTSRKICKELWIKTSELWWV